MADKLNYKVGMIGALDMLRFKNMPKVREKAIQAASSAPLPKTLTTNEKAKQRHPEKQEVIVAEIRRNGADAKTIVLKTEDGSALAPFRAGQYISVCVPIGGTVTTRSYSLCSSPAWEDSCAPLLTLTNIGTNGGFSSDIAHSIFSDMTAQNALVENTLAALRSRGYYGVNLNIEYVQPYDREGYNAFLKRMSETLHANGYMLSSAVAPKTSDDQYGVLYTAHDYAAHGQYCDRVVIMTYEWGYTYSSPRAVSPVNEIRKVLSYAVTKMPPSKILLGFSNYGYNWLLPWKQGQAAQVISNAAAASLAASVFAQIKFDETAQAPFFNYTDPSGRRHEVWFEDARSVRARLALVREFGLAGISIWTVNMRNRAGLAVLESEFSSEKIV